MDDAPRVGSGIDAIPSDLDSLVPPTRLGRRGAVAGRRTGGLAGPVAPAASTPARPTAALERSSLARTDAAPAAGPRGRRAGPDA